MAQFASAGYWKTVITLINTGTVAALARLNFFDNEGKPLVLPLNFPQSSSGGPLLASTLDRTLNPGAGVVIETSGPDNAPALVGWAQLLTNGNVGGLAVLRQQIGASGSEAVVPFENRNAANYALWFDNTSGLITGVAAANLTLQPLNISVTIRDDTGTVLPTVSPFPSRDTPRTFLLIASR